MSNKRYHYLSSRRLEEDRKTYRIIKILKYFRTLNQDQMRDLKTLAIKEALWWRATKAPDRKEGPIPFEWDEVRRIEKRLAIGHTKFDDGVTEIIGFRYKSPVSVVAYRQSEQEEMKIDELLCAKRRGKKKGKWIGLDSNDVLNSYGHPRRLATVRIYFHFDVKIPGTNPEIEYSSGATLIVDNLN